MGGGEEFLGRFLKINSLITCNLNNCCFQVKWPS